MSKQQKAVVERVTDADIARAFDGTNFGRTDHKHLLAVIGCLWVLSEAAKLAGWLH